MKVFVRDFLWNFKIGFYDMRVVVIKFSSFVYCVFNFYIYLLFGDISVVLLNIVYVGGGINIVVVLCLVCKIIIYRCLNVVIVVIVLIDG